MIIGNGKNPLATGLGRYKSSKPQLEAEGNKLKKDEILKFETNKPDELGVKVEGKGYTI